MPEPRKTTKEKKHTSGLNPAQENILEELYRFHFLTIGQFMRLLGYSKGSETTVSTYLKRMAPEKKENEEEKKSGYVQPLYLPRNTRYGKALLVYTIARKGINYLVALGKDVHPRFHPVEEEEKSYFFLKHTLDVNDFLISCTLIEKQYPAITLHSFIHERDLKRANPVKVQFEKINSDGSKVLDSSGKVQYETMRIIPDAFLDFRIEQQDLGRRYRYCLLLELDRNTIEAKNFKRKVRGLLTLVKNEALCIKHFGAKIPTIAFVNTVGGEKRRDQMRKWVEEELRKTKERDFWANVFLFTNVDAEMDSEQLLLGAVWMTPFGSQPVALLSAGSR
jgi:hypothetical protein